MSNIFSNFDDVVIEWAEVCLNLWALILVMLVVFLNPAGKRDERFFNTESAEQHLKTTKECRMCWLRRSELSGLDLRSAILEGAELSGTDLNAANLADANLRFARMRRADLATVVSLQGADLSYADLRESNVLSAVLKTAVLCNTILPSGEVSPCR